MIRVKVIFRIIFRVRLSFRARVSMIRLFPLVFCTIERSELKSDTLSQSTSATSTKHVFRGTQVENPCTN